MPALAFVYLVDSTDDAVDADTSDGVCATAANTCTLRAAIQQANAWPGHDFIILPPGTHTLTLEGRGEAAAATGDLDITGDLTLRGAGAALTVIDAGGIDRVFDIIGQDTQVEISGVTIRNGLAQAQATPADNGVGGGIRNQGRLTLRDSVVSDNASSPANPGFAGGGIHHAASAGAVTLVLERVAVTGNLATGNLTASGGGIAIVNGGARIARSVISGNTAESALLPPQGGADGGGMEIGDGNVTIADTTISGNSASRRGGGISSFGAGPGAVLTIERSTISGNTAYFGGGIYDDGAPSRTLTIVNSTVSGNTAEAPPDSSFSGAAGGGIFASKPVSLRNVTITGNTAEPGLGGGLYVDPVGTGGPGGNQGSATIGNTIIAAAAGSACGGAVVNITPNGPNLAGDASCNMGGTVAAPQLGALAAGNGGPTAVHVPQGGSPAIDTGSNTICPETDQRGFPRPVGNCDIGAVEVTPGIQADLALDVLDRPDPVAVNATLAYVLEVVNQGPDAATGAQVGLSLPAGASFASADAGCAPAGGVVNCTIGALAAGAAETLTVNVTPNTVGTLTAEADGGAAQNDPNPANNTGVEVLTEAYAPTALSIAMTAETTGIVIPAGGGDDTTGAIGADATIIAGQRYTYVLTLHNTGATARNVRIYNTLPAGISPLSGASVTPAGTDRGCAVAGQLITCTLGDVPAGPEVAVIRIPAMPNTKGTKVNRAVGNFDGSFVGSPPADELSIEVDTRADLAVTMAASANPVTVGANLGYVVTVTNNGPSTATSPQVSVSLDDSVEYDSASAAGWSCEAVSGGVDCSRASLNAGARADLVLFTVPGAPGEVTATAVVSAEDNNDPVPGNNTATVLTTVDVGPLNQPDLSAALTAVPVPGTAGSNMSFNSTVTNVGDQTATSVTLTQTLPAGASFQSATSGCTRDGSFVHCDMGTIIAGTSASVTVVVRPASPGDITTSILALDGAGNDTNLLNNEASLTVGVNSAPGPGLRAGDRCFIATAAYGSHLDPHVAALRTFRDRYLLTHPAGAAFVAWYYEISPPIAAVIAEHEALRTLVRWTLTPVVYAAAYPLPAAALVVLIALAALRRGRREAAP